MATSKPEIGQNLGLLWLAHGRLTIFVTETTSAGVIDGPNLSDIGGVDWGTLGQ